MPSARPPAVQLFIPHLLPAQPGPGDAPLLHSPVALNQLMSRSAKTRAPAEHFCALLCTTFEVQRQQDWPVAPLALLGDGASLAPATGYAPTPCTCRRRSMS